MILYDENFNFIGMSAETLTFLGYEDMDEFGSMHNDFANLFVKKQGYVAKFEGFSWIHYVLYSGAGNKKAIVAKKNGEEVPVDLSIKEIFLYSSIENSSKFFAVKLIHDSFASLQTEEQNTPYPTQQGHSNITLSNLINSEPNPNEILPDIAHTSTQVANEPTPSSEPFEVNLLKETIETSTQNEETTQIQNEQKSTNEDDVFAFSLDLSQDSQESPKVSQTNKNDETTPQSEATLQEEPFRIDTQLFAPKIETQTTPPQEEEEPHIPEVKIELVDFHNGEPVETVQESSSIHSLEEESAKKSLEPTSNHQTPKEESLIKTDLQDPEAPLSFHLLDQENSSTANETEQPLQTPPSFDLPKEEEKEETPFKIDAFLKPLQEEENQEKDTTPSIEDFLLKKEPNEDKNLQQIQQPETTIEISSDSLQATTEVNQKKEEQEVPPKILEQKEILIDQIKSDIKEIDHLNQNDTTFNKEEATKEENSSFLNLDILKGFTKKEEPAKTEKEQEKAIEFADDAPFSLSTLLKKTQPNQTEKEQESTTPTPVKEESIKEDLQQKDTIENSQERTEVENEVLAPEMLLKQPISQEKKSEEINQSTQAPHEAILDKLQEHISQPNAIHLSTIIENEANENKNSLSGSFEETLNNIFTELAPLSSHKEENLIKESESSQLASHEEIAVKKEENIEPKVQNQQSVTKEDIKSEPNIAVAVDETSIELPTLGGLGLSNEEEIELINEFIDDTTLNIAMIEEYIQINDFDNIKYNLIKIKSSADILNLDALIDISNELIEGSKNQDKDTITNGLQILKKYLAVYRKHFSAIAA